MGTSNSKTMSSQMQLLVLAYSHVTQSSAPLPLLPSAPPPSPPSCPPRTFRSPALLSPLLSPPPSPPLPTCNKPALPCRCCLSFLFFCLRVLLLTVHCVVQDSAPALSSCLFARPPFLFRLLGSGLLMQSRSFPCPLVLSSRGGRRSVKIKCPEKRAEKGQFLLRRCAGNRTRPSEPHVLSVREDASGCDFGILGCVIGPFWLCNRRSWLPKKRVGCASLVVASWRRRASRSCKNAAMQPKAVPKNPLGLKPGGREVWRNSAQLHVATIGLVQQ